MDSNSPIESIRNAVKERHLNKEWFSSAEFQALIDQFDREIKQLPSNKRAEYASVLGRASSVSKPAYELFISRLAIVLSSPLDSAYNLSDGDDRIYLAKAVQFVNPQWAYEFSVSQLVEEDVAEKARKVWAEIALSGTNRFQTFLADVNSILPSALNRMNTVDPDSHFKRIRRIFSSFSDELAIQDLDNGPEFGKELNVFLHRHGATNGPESKKLKAEIGENYLSSIRKLLRLNLEANQEPEIYRIVGRIQKWWKPASPPEKVRTEIDHIVKIGAKTIFIHAKQGIQNVPLRRVLNSLVDSSSVNKILDAYASSDLSLDQKMSHWLSSGTEIKSQQKNEAVSNLNKKNEDETLAELMLLFDAPSFKAKSLAQITDNIDPIFPDESEMIITLKNNIGLVEQWFTTLIQKRGLELFCPRGEVIRYNPAEHEANHEIDANVEVRVQKPGVKVSNLGRPTRIIRKPIVRKL